jgi:hypothetical protein
MRLASPLRGARDVDQDPAVLDLHRVSRNRVFFEPRLAFAGTAVELPMVPGAFNVVTVETAVTERATDVIARVGYYAKPAVLERHGELAILDAYALQWRSR